MKQRIVYVLVVMFSLWPVTAFAASPVLMTDIQYWPASDQLQTIISFSEPVQPRYHYRDNPPRFVLEIANCQDIWGEQTILVDDAVLQQIRVQRLANGITQVVFDLTAKVETSVQTLPRFKDNPDRVVVSLPDSVQEEKSQPQQLVKNRPVVPRKQIEPYIVVVDPGHGGQDSGAMGQSGLQEKDVVLDIARTMQAMLEQTSSTIKVYLTRTGDEFLQLPKRTEMAEKYKADLFISLHVNANPSSKAHGFSVYTLSENATDAAARELAEKENAADLIFSGAVTPTPHNDALLSFVLADLSQTSWLQHSLEFGQMAMNASLVNVSQYKIAKEGLKRANFVVLRTASMPAVLVEACYMSNAREEALLNNQAFRTKIAQALANSTVEYFAKIRNSSKNQLAQVQRVSALSLPRDSEGSDDSSQYKVHVVRSGESLSLIAGKYKVELDQLRQVNRLASAHDIYVGQRLWIP
jgi:N-acetylmuramoyl-L-alanine amidase